MWDLVISSFLLLSDGLDSQIDMIIGLRTLALNYVKITPWSYAHKLAP